MIHGSQPNERARSKRSDEDEGEDAFDLVNGLKRTYQACKDLINTSTSMRTSEAGKKWLGIIETRLKWLSEDEGKLLKKHNECSLKGGKLY